MSDVLEIAFQKVAGLACHAPYVDVSAKTITGSAETGVFKLRVDTGADITTIPRGAIKGMQLVQGRPVRTTQANGKICQGRTYLATICVHNGNDVWEFRPERGVLLRDCEYGLLGMDILDQLSMLMMDETLILERKGNE